MEPCITLRRSIMTASQVLNSQDPANPLLAAAKFLFIYLIFFSFGVFCPLKQGPLTREHALAC